MKDLSKIAKLREQKGKENKTLDIISKAIAETEKTGDKETLSKLYWEASLVHQHMVMNERSLDNPDNQVIQKETNEMERSAKKAHKIIEENKINKLKATSHRFLGRVMTYKGNHTEAQKEYEKSIELIEQKENKEQLLELRGFLAPTLLINGRIDEGVQLALTTFNDYEGSQIGKGLKEKDYYTWAVWRSGLITRMVFAMNEAGVPLEKEKWKTLIDTCGTFLKNPEGDVWGDFQFRLDEVEKARGILDS